MKSLQISAYFHLPYEKLYNITYNYDVSYSNILKNQYYEPHGDSGSSIYRHAEKIMKMIYESCKRLRILGWEMHFICYLWAC